MIWRIAASAAAAAPLAAEAVTKSAPVQWIALGYHFEAAGMIAAVFGCLVARVWHGSAQAARKTFRWQLDAPISAMTIGATIALIMKVSPEPWLGLLYGTGMGVVGEGLFKLAERVLRASGLFGEGPSEGAGG